MTWAFWLLLIPTSFLVGLRIYAEIALYLRAKRIEAWSKKACEEARIESERTAAIENERWRKLSPEEQAAELACKKANAERRRQERIRAGWQLHYSGAEFLPRDLMDKKEVHLLEDPTAVLSQADRDAGWEILEVYGKRYKVLPHKCA